ncbi:hypothetical protein AAC387_Pa05g3131 [Persea americana]
MHAKTDSEVTSLAPSSPARSPRRPVYYVQSPSGDSHDGDKTTTSFHSTPVALSPTTSPRHSSTTRKLSQNNPSRISLKAYPSIEEEGLLEDDDINKPLPRRYYFLAFVLGFILLFSIFSLILWGASRSKKPHISMKSITFERFVIQAGTDSTGVPTDMISLNSTVTFGFRNRATFFGVHVESTPLDLSFSQLTIANGDVKKFFQSRKSQRAMNVVVSGSKVPLYGGGSSWSSSTGNVNVSVPLKLSFMVRARAYVLGKLVKPKFHIKVDCPVVLDPTKLNNPVSLKNSCQYS